MTAQTMAERLTLEQQRRALDIVERCVGLDLATQHTQVEALCQDDKLLNAKVRRLLDLATATSDDWRLLGPQDADVEPMPDRIGKFRITRLLGHGGMGAVYQGVRDDGVFEQVVAIKHLRKALANVKEHERFARERQILARLNHHAIGHILDGGDHDGRPYLAMELCAGLPITDYVFIHRLPLEARLRLFIQVCEAVQYAHRSLVVHADLKPANILVDAEQVKLLDFGVARLLDEEAPLEAASAMTRAYASPERKAGAAPAVASDVFSLGALLFEMLTGARPDSASATQQEKMPAGASVWPRPSAHSGADGVAAARLEGDLDAIVEQAVASDPAQRYPDVAALTADVHRFLADQPVAARGGDRFYRAQKFIVRHKRGVIATAAFAVALACAAVFSTIQYVRAEQAKAAADERFFEVRNLSNFMLFALYDKLSDAPGTVQARAELAETARHYLDTLRSVDDAPADLRLNAARAYRRLAAVQGLAGVASLGQPEQAARSLDVAEAMVRAIIAEQPGNADAQAELGWLISDRWTLQADNAESRAVNARAAAAFSAALGLDPDHASARLGLLTTEKNRGFDLYWANDRPDEALAVYQATLQQLRTMHFSPELDAERLNLEVQLLNRTGDVLYDRGALPDALVAYREAETIIRRQLIISGSRLWLDRLGEALYNVSGTLADIDGREHEALRAAREGISVMERVLSYGYDASAEKRLSILYGQEALVLVSLRRRQEAVAADARSLTIRERRQAAAPDDPMRNRDLAIGLNTHSQILEEAGRYREACAVAQRAVDQWASIEARGRLSSRDARRNVPEARDRASRRCG